MYIIILLFCTITQAMDHQIEPWQRQQFWDLIEDDNQHQEKINWNTDIQEYLDARPLGLPISRRSCIATGIFSSVFGPPAIASQHTLQSYLSPLPFQTYLVGIGIVSVWSIYELKKFIDVYKKHTNQDENNIFEYYN